MTSLPLLIILLLVIALLFRVDFIFYIVYVTIGIYVWSHWYTPRALRLLQLERKFNNHAFLGEGISVAIVITNTSRFPVPWLQLNESIAVELRGGTNMRRAFTLGGRADQSFSYIIRAMRRGYYQLGPGQITGGDLFGFKENRVQMQVDYLTVYPRIVPLARFSTQAKLPFGTIRSNQPLFRDPSRPVGTREFRHGDSLRHINWKASAHSDELLVKTYLPAMSLETMILLNLNVNEFSGRNRFDGPEWAISLVASIAAFLIDQRQAVGLATNGADPLLKLSEEEQNPVFFDQDSGRLTLKTTPVGKIQTEQEDNIRDWLIPSPILPNPGRAHLMTVLELLARLEATRSLPFSQWSINSHSYLSWGITILVISPSGDLPTCRSLHNMVRRGFNPILIITEPYTDFPAIQRRVRPFGFRTVHISSEKDLQSWLAPINRIRN